MSGILMSEQQVCRVGSRTDWRRPCWC